MTVERAAYSAAEAAELLGWSRDDVYYHARNDPGFPCIRSGRTLLIPRRRFDAWLAGETTASNVVGLESALKH